MMETSAKSILEWRGTDSTERALLHVVDNDLDSRDLDYQRFEIAEYDEEKDKWKTVESIDFIDEIIDFGIPQKADS